MTRSFIPILVLLTACSTKPELADETGPTTSGSTVRSPVSTEKIAATKDSLSLNAGAIVPDSALYIGEVGTFPETNELYTPVYYHDGLNTEGLYESISKQADSLVYEDIERRRKRIPMATARNYFTLFETRSTVITVVLVFEVAYWDRRD